MDVNINVDVGIGALLNKSRQTTQVNRQAAQENNSKKKVEVIASQKRQEKLRSEGRDASGNQLNRPAVLQSFQKQKPAAYRQGESLFINGIGIQEFFPLANGQQNKLRISVPSNNAIVFDAGYIQSSSNQLDGPTAYWFTDSSVAGYTSFCNGTSSLWSLTPWPNLTIVPSPPTSQTYYTIYIRELYFYSSLPENENISVLLPVNSGKAVYCFHRMVLNLWNHHFFVVQQVNTWNPSTGFTTGPAELAQQSTESMEPQIDRTSFCCLVGVNTAKPTQQSLKAESGVMEIEVPGQLEQAFQRLIPAPNLNVVNQTINLGNFMTASYQDKAFTYSSTNDSAAVNTAFEYSDPTILISYGQYYDWGNRSYSFASIDEPIRGSFTPAIYTLLLDYQNGLDSSDPASRDYSDVASEYDLPQVKFVYTYVDFFETQDPETGNSVISIVSEPMKGMPESTDSDITELLYANPKYKVIELQEPQEFDVYPVESEEIGPGSYGASFFQVMPWVSWGSQDYRNQKLQALGFNPSSLSFPATP